MTFERVWLVLLTATILIVGIALSQSKKQGKAHQAENIELRELISELQEEVLIGGQKATQARSELNERITALGTLPDIDEVASEVVSGHLDNLAGALFAQISQSEESIDILKGPPGTPADPVDVAKSMVSHSKDELVDEIAQAMEELWGIRAFYNEPLIATVADEVYNKYGSALRPSAARAEDIAAVLSDSPTFADLVAVLMNDRSQ